MTEEVEEAKDYLEKLSEPREKLTKSPGVTGGIV